MQYERVRGGILWYPVTTLQCHVTCPPVINDHFKQELLTVKANERQVINICLQSSVKDLNRQVQTEMTIVCSCLQSEHVMNPVYNILVVWLSDQDCLTSFAYWEGTLEWTQETGAATDHSHHDTTIWEQKRVMNNQTVTFLLILTNFKNFSCQRTQRVWRVELGLEWSEMSGVLQWSDQWQWEEWPGAGWLTLPSPVIRARYNTDNNIVTLTLLRPCWVVHSTQDQIIPKTSERLT